MAGPALVEQEGLDQERPEDAAGELREDVDERIDRVDPPSTAAARVTSGLKCPPLTTPRVMINPNSTNAWTSPTTAKSEPVCAVALVAT